MGVWSNKCHTKEMLESGLMFAQPMNQSVSMCVCKLAICVAPLTSRLPWQLLTVFEGECGCVCRVLLIWLCLPPVSRHVVNVLSACSHDFEQILWLSNYFRDNKLTHRCNWRDNLSLSVVLLFLHFKAQTFYFFKFPLSADASLCVSGLNISEFKVHVACWEDYILYPLGKSVD